MQRHHPKRYNLEDGIFDFEGLGSMLAMGEGVANKMHLDGGDSPRTLAVILSTGTAVAYFCIPQLNVKIPLRAGQCLAVSARMLSHYAHHVEGTGKHNVFTFFTDSGSVAKMEGGK